MQTIDRQGFGGTGRAANSSWHGLQNIVLHSGSIGLRRKQQPPFVTFTPAPLSRLLLVRRQQASVKHIHWPPHNVITAAPSRNICSLGKREHTAANESLQQGSMSNVHHDQVSGIAHGSFP